MNYWLLAAGVLSLLTFLIWRILVIGCEEPLVNQRRRAWWNQ